MKWRSPKLQEKIGDLSGNDIIRQIYQNNLQYNDQPKAFTSYLSKQFVYVLKIKNISIQLSNEFVLNWIKSNKIWSKFFNTIFLQGHLYHHAHRHWEEVP